MKRIVINTLAIMSFFWLCFLVEHALPDDAIATLTGHSDSVWSVCFSRDGRLLATGSSDSSVRLWNVYRREEIAELRHSDSVRSVSFSPDNDLLAVGCWDGMVKLWDVSRREEVAELRNPDSIRSVSFSPDGDLLACGSWDGTVRLWDVSRIKGIARLRHSDGVSSVSFGPNGNLLASGSWDGMVKLWDLATYEEAATLTGHSDSVRSVSFSPDGDLLASGSHDGTVKLWDTTSHAELEEFRHSSRVFSVSFSPDGDALASGSQDGTVKLWDLVTSEEAATFIGHSDSVLSVSFSPNGNLLASGSHDGTVKLWEAILSEKIRPTADFSASSTSGRPPLTVSFTDLSANNPTSWLWDFGDDETSAQRNPMHTYTEPDHYTVKLTVENSAGSDKITKRDYIYVVDAQPPLADFSADPRSDMPMKRISFTCLSENGPTTWLWDFGDGATSDRRNPTHKYTQPGFYTVSLRVENPVGFDTRTKTDYIHIVGAKITLDSGTLNGIKMDPLDPEITVLGGARISGELDIIVNNAHESDELFPIGATPTWGDRETSYWTITEHAESGSEYHSVSINLKAPLGAGTYYIVMAGAAHWDIEHVMSCTHRINIDGVWYDDNDVADWDFETIQNAIDYGFVTVPWLVANGQYEDLETSAAAVKVTVTRMQPISYPCGVATSGSGDVYLADTGNNRILKFASDGALLNLWGTKGSGPGQFDWPQSIAVDALGNVYVADRNNHRIQKFTSDGRSLNSWGTPGAGNRQFNWPNGVAVDSLGHVYVVDTRNHRVQKFLSNGVFLKAWGTRGTGAGQFDWPQGIAADNSGNIYVTDKNSHCVQKFTSEGVFLKAWGTWGHGDGELKEPMDVATDTSGYVYVADTSNHRIQRFTSDGVFLDTIGKWGYDEGGISSPQGVEVDELGYVYVADTGNNRIQRLILTHTIEVTAGANGRISPSGDSGRVVVNHREDQTFTIIPDEGYHTSVVLVDGRPIIGGAVNHTFEDVVGPHTIEAIFMVDDHIITATANGNGSISPSGEVAVKHRGVEAFTIAPDEGHHVADVLVDGESVGVVSSYEFVSVAADHTIEATFAADDYTIAGSAGDNGNISPAGTVSVRHGESQVFTITPDEGYYVMDVLVDNEPVSSGISGNRATLSTNGVSDDGSVSYTFMNVMSDHSISATFAPDRIRGDTNGDGRIMSNDAIMALRIAANLIDPTPDQEYGADVNNDGKIMSNDAIVILRMAAGLTAPAWEAAGAAGRMINVTLGKAYGAAGESVRMPLKVDSIGMLAGGDMRITYDSSVLQAVDISPDPRVLLASNIAKPGAIRIAFTSTDGLSGKAIACVEFHVIADDISPIAFSMLELYGADAQPLNSEGVDAEFRSWAIPPEHSALLPNFPNPFNPETWIPYHLREANSVVVRIHNVVGQVVRTLDLGFRDAGVYASQSKAAHWDGRNEAGEEVASGLYFYSIEAGDFSAMRKMVVGK